MWVTLATSVDRNATSQIAAGIRPQYRDVTHHVSWVTRLISSEITVERLQCRNRTVPVPVASDRAT